MATWHHRRMTTPTSVRVLRPRVSSIRCDASDPVPVRRSGPTIRVWWVLAAWALLWSLAQVPGGMYSWHYFVTGSMALASPNTPSGGLHVYAAHPELQMGPLTLLVATVLLWAGGFFSTVLGALAMIVLGLISLRMLVTAAGSLRGQPPSPRTTLLAGLLMIPAWAVLSVHYGHLDDVLASTLTIAAITRLVRDRPWAATILSPPPPPPNHGRFPSPFYCWPTLTNAPTVLQLLPEYRC